MIMGIATPAHAGNDPAPLWADVPEMATPAQDKSLLPGQRFDPPETTLGIAYLHQHFDALASDDIQQRQCRTAGRRLAALQLRNVAGRGM